MLKKKKENNNEFCAKLVVLYYFLLPIYLILQLKIGIKAHFTVPIIYLLIVIKNYKNHDDNSPFLIGGFLKNDTIKEAKQESWIIGEKNV